MADDLEKFMNQTKMKHEDLDKELDELMNEDEDLRQMLEEDKKTKGKGNKKNVEDLDDINLSDLEEEDEKKDNSIDMKDLEDEPKNDKKEDEKVSKKIINKPSAAQLSTKEEIKISIDTKTKIEIAEKNKVLDIYTEKSEKLYHRTDKMQSLGALQEDLKTIEGIIKFKKENELDFDFFETKKDMIEVKAREIENMISFGAMDLEEYKTTIKVQLSWEEELIKFLQKDQKISKEESHIILERINKRIEIINSELAQEIQEEEEEPENVEEPKENSKPESKDNSKTELVEKEDKKTNEPPKTEKINMEVETSIEKTPEIKNKKLYEDLLTKLQDYKDAIEYFRKIGSANQEEDAVSKAREIQQAIRLIEEGKESKVDEFSLPIGVTPDYICGYTKQERLNKFSEIIKEFSKRKNELNDALVQRTEKLKLIDKKEFVKIKDAVKKDLDERKSKIDFYNKLIIKLTEFAKNPWVPAPLYSFVEEEEKTEKINDNIDPFFIDIYIGKTTYDKTNAYLMINLILGENKQLTEYVYFKNYPNYDTHVRWKLDKSDWNYLHRKYLEIQVYRTHWYWPFKALLKGTFKMKLDPLKDISQISDSFPIKLESNRFDPKLDLTITIRTPTTGKEWSITSKAVLTITKTFPPFRGEGAVENHSYPGSDKKVNISDKEIVSNTKPKQEKIESKPKPKAPTEKKEGAKPKTVEHEKIDPSEFTKEELADPDIPDNFNSVKVMEFKIEKIQKEINSIEGRAPPKLREKLIKTKCRKNVLEQQLGDTLSIDDYILIMNKQLMKDRKLAIYFEQEKMIEQGKKVAERIPILMKELDEAIAYSKSQKKK